MKKMQTIYLTLLCSTLALCGSWTSQDSSQTHESDISYVTASVKKQALLDSTLRDKWNRALLTGTLADIRAIESQNNWQPLSPSDITNQRKSLVAYFQGLPPTDPNYLKSQALKTADLSQDSKLNIAWYTAILNGDWAQIRQMETDNQWTPLTLAQLPTLQAYLKKIGWPPKTGPKTAVSAVLEYMTAAEKKMQIQNNDKLKVTYLLSLDKWIKNGDDSDLRNLETTNNWEPLADKSMAQSEYNFYSQ